MLTSEKFMTARIISVHPETSMLDAYKLMYDKNVRHLPVIDKNQRLVGMLSDRDVQRAMIADKISDYIQEISLNSEKKVSDFMSWPVYTVHSETPLKAVIEEMIEKKISSVVVADQAGRCSGIITTEDLLKLLKTRLESNVELNERPLSFFTNVLF